MRLFSASGYFLYSNSKLLIEVSFFILMRYVGQNCPCNIVCSDASMLELAISVGRMLTGIGLAFKACVQLTLVQATERITQSIFYIALATTCTAHTPV